MWDIWLVVPAVMVVLFFIYFIYFTFYFPGETARYWKWNSDRAKERKLLAKLYQEKKSLVERPKTSEEQEKLRQSLNLRLTALETDQRNVLECQKSSVASLSTEDYNNIYAEYKDAIALIGQELAQLQSMSFDDEGDVTELLNIGGRVSLVKQGERVVEFRFSGLEPGSYKFTVRGQSQTLDVNGEINLHHSLFGLQTITSSQLTVESTNGRDEVHW